MATKRSCFQGATAGGFLALGFVGACIGPSDSLGWQTYETQSEFCRAAAAASCTENVVLACYASDRASYDEDFERCVETRSRASACNPENLPYQPEQSGRCVAAYGEVWSNAALTRNELRALRDVCEPVFSRQRARGAGCSADHDCDVSAGLVCAKKVGEDRGRCIEPVFVGGGSRCAQLEVECTVGFYCDKQVGSCLQKRDVGESCSDAEPCEEALRCAREPGSPRQGRETSQGDAAHGQMHGHAHGAMPGAERASETTGDQRGICRPRLENGARCSAHDECRGGFCLPTEGGSACASRLALAFGTYSCESFRDTAEPVR